LTSDDAAPRISFCVTCRNRLWQLKETLPDNLAQLRAGHEAVLVDYGSSDGLAAWVWDNFERPIRDGRLLFFEVVNDVRWSSPRAKNLAHRLARGDYLFNLDADNWITGTDIDQIEREAALGNPCHQFSGATLDGSYGRIGVSRALFHDIGGYDESFLPMSGQDRDFLRRIRFHRGAAIELPPSSRQAIPNSCEEKLAEVVGIEDRSQLHYDKIKYVNRQLSNAKMIFEGPVRKGGFASFRGRLNGEMVTLDGFDVLRREAP